MGPGALADQAQGPIGLVVKLPFATAEEMLARYGANMSRGGIYLRSRTVKPPGTAVTLGLYVLGTLGPSWAFGLNAETYVADERDGVMCLRLPRAESEKPRSVAIN